MAESEAPHALMAPCRELAAGQSVRWIAAGWRDLRASPGASLGFGLVSVLLSWLIAALAWRFGDLGLYLGLLSGFVFLGPLLAMTWYVISARQQKGAPVSWRLACRDALHAAGDAIVFAIILLVVFLIWARAAAMVHIFFPLGGTPSPLDWAVFLVTGSAVGALFCAVIFAISAFSLPMMLDRHADTVTAMLSSINAVLRNKGAMLVWVLLIGGAMVLAVATLFVALAVLMPVLGHAAWHGYRDTLDVHEWAERPLSAAP